MSKLNTNAIRHLGSSVDNMTFDASGRVLMPNQVAFLAKVGTAYNQAAYDSPLTNTYAVYNTGNCYNASTHTFTAPVTGLYDFKAILRMDRNVSYIYADPIVNGVRQYDSWGLFGLHTGASSGFTAGTSTFQIRLNAGDSVRLNLGISDNASTSVNTQTSWSGRLVG